MEKNTLGSCEQSGPADHDRIHHCCCSHSKENFDNDSALDMSRRDFLVGLGAAAGLGAWLMTPSKAQAFIWNSKAEPIPRIGRPLKVKPVLVYILWQRREAHSWRHWGGLHNQNDVEEEVKRIEAELKALKAKAEFGIELMPVSRVSSADEAQKITDCDCDMFLVYAQSYGRGALEVFAETGKPNMMFARHKSGPVYHGYECLHHRFIRGSTDEPKVEEVDYRDVVIDDYDEVLWRLRALYGLRNTLGTKIVAIGGVSGWGRMGAKFGPEVARELWKMDMTIVEYKDLEPMIKNKLDSPQEIAKAQRQAEKYLSRGGVKSYIEKQPLVNAFVLTNLFKELMAQANAPAMTIKDCMGVIMPMAQTTACVPLNVINDEGLIAFCESDFVAIPSGVLLRYISGKPVFLNDPTFPHKGVTTCAHCTAPSKMNGKSCDPIKIVTHFESDYGAAPKVEFKKGQIVTGIVPAFGCKKWVGFRAKIVDHPFLDICRSQVDIEIQGDWKRLVNKTVGFHWMLCYGDYLKETGYALKKMGIEWENVSS